MLKIVLLTAKSSVAEARQMPQSVATKRTMQGIIAPMMWLPEILAAMKRKSEQKNPRP